MGDINTNDVGVHIITKDVNSKSETDKVSKNIKGIGDTANKTSKSISGALGKIGFGGLVSGMYKVGKQIVELTKQSSDYIESLNVLQVAFDGETDSIRKFTSTISETLNLDDASLIKMAGSFKTLANSMSYSEKVGQEFSKMMTQITLDTASLYNMDIAKTQSMLQSAIQGQGKSLKTNTGASVLESTVQTTLDVLGIDAYVEDMNDAEKAIARVIAISYQLRNSQGDLARTIEAPANQFRVMGEQVKQLARNIGNVFLPILKDILPYLNAILIVLNKIISSLASLVGFDETEWDNYEDNATALGDAFKNLGGAVGGVGDAAKETQKQLKGLRGFDKLNVINTPTPSNSSGSGGGGGANINPNLLKAFESIFGNYNSMLDGVETKATQIAKAIMKALGEIDFSNLIASGKRLWEAFKPFAENVGKGLLWTFEKVLVPLGKWTISDLLPTFLDILANSFKILNTAIKTFTPFGEWLWENFLSPLAKFTGGVIITWLKNLENLLNQISKSRIWSTITVGAAGLLLLSKNFSKFTTLIKNANLYKMFQEVKKGVETYKQLNKSFGNSYSSLEVLKGGIQRANKEWRIQQGIVDETTGKLKKQTGVASALSSAFGGIITASLGFTTVDAAFKDMNENGLNLTNTIGGLTGAVALLSGAIKLGASLFPNYGLAIGAVVGIIGLAVTAFNNFKSSSDEATEGLKAYEIAQKRLDETTRNKLETDLIVHDNNAQLVDELNELVDSNGKVKKSDEARANYILHTLNEAYGTQYKVIKGKITLDGKEVESIGKVIDEYKNQIKWMKLKAVASAYEEDYEKLLKKSKTAADNLSNAEENRESKTAALEKALKNYMDNASAANFKELAFATSEAKAAEDKYKTVKETYDKQKKDIKNYQDFQSAILAEDYDKALELGGNFYDNSEDLANNYKDKTVKTVKDVSTKITEMFNKLPTKKDMKIKVDADTSSFSTKVANAFKNIKIGNFSLSSIFKQDGGILVNGQWRDIAKYDTGGLPPVGQMFVARERGPELVGNIGGHTAVMNNDQIVSSVSSGVYQAVRSAMGNQNNNGGVYNIYLDENHKLGSYTLEQLKGMAKSNGKPITIS